ncbi:MAG: hypothetical protein WAX07_02800 [Candidatus Altiarchaeia archaeon]
MTKDFEIFNKIPIKFKKEDGLTIGRPDCTSEEHENYLKEIARNRPKLKEEINRKITRLISLTEEYNSIDFLAAIAIGNLLTNSESSKEQDVLDCYIEYVLSISLATGKESKKEATNEIVEEFNKLVPEIFEEVYQYFESEFAEVGLGNFNASLRTDVILWYVFFRGESRPTHHIDMLKAIFSEHNAFLRKHYNFTIDEIINIIYNLGEQLTRNLLKCDVTPLLKERDELYNQFLVTEGITDSSKLSTSDIATLESKFSSLPEIKGKDARLYYLRNIIVTNPFEIDPTEEIPIEFLRQFSSKLGDNSIFNFRESPYWPTNDSIVHESPFVEKQGKFYVFAPHILFRNLGSILENWIQKKDPKYFKENYLPKRAEYLERKTVQYFRDIFKEADVFGKLYYFVEENGEQKRVEIDGLVIYDNNILVIEAKSGNWSRSARRGSPLRMKDNLKKLVDESYTQATRTKKYITESKKPAIFYFENGSEAITIKLSDPNIFLINVTLGSLGQISTKLAQLKNVDIISGNDNFWSVFINDLRVISELIEFPSEFLDYLKKRNRLNNYPYVHASEELDFFMFYLREGLQFETEHLEKYAIEINDYAKNLKEYYNYIYDKSIYQTEEIEKEIKKPTLSILGPYKKLILQLESEVKPGFTEVTTELLKFRIVQQQSILQNLQKANKLSQDGFYDCSFSFGPEGDRGGFTFSVSLFRDAYFWKEMEASRMKEMKENDCKKWTVLAFGLLLVDNDLDFRVYYT